MSTADIVRLRDVREAFEEEVASYRSESKLHPSIEVDLNLQAQAIEDTLTKVMAQLPKGPKAGDVIYVRRALGVGLALLTMVGAGPDEGYLWVRTWNEKSKTLRRVRRIPIDDERGIPSERDPQVRRVRRVAGEAT